MGTLLFWTMEGRLKGSQTIMLRRSNELQQGMLAYLRDGAFPDDFLDQANLGLLMERDAVLPDRVSFQRTVAAMKHNDVVTFYALVCTIAFTFLVIA